MIMFKTDTKYTGHYISGHLFHYFSTRGEEAIYAPSQKSNPTCLYLQFTLYDEKSRCRSSKWHTGGRTALEAQDYS